MGAGKTVVGKRLAKSLGLSFYDLDAEIEANFKMSIPTIFNTFGENNFRNLETQTLKQFASSDNFVLSCGGGTPCFNDNILQINNLGISIYIKMPAKALVNRIQNSHKKRPLTEGKSPDELLKYTEETLAFREQFYNQSKIIVDGLNLNIEELVEKIKVLL